MTIASIKPNSIRLIRAICALSGSPTFLADICRDLDQNGIVRALDAHDTSALYSWLLTAFSYQGISDSVVTGFISHHGGVEWRQIEAELSRQPTCSRLRNYWRFSGCHYNKNSARCSEPKLIESCPLPRHPLRNGRLNQTAYSLYLFIRDHAKGDLVVWIDEQLRYGPPDQFILAPLRNIYGVSDKILTMSLSSLLLGAPDLKPLWFEVGKDMIAVDSLVHNFLHRTGLLEKCARPHLYGPACYQTGGCADLIRSLALRIDAYEFNPAFPTYFPRFVQHAIWRYCAAEQLNLCNGNRINDQRGCTLSYCQVAPLCHRKPLKVEETSILPA